ncbi:MAG: hypothetical protein R3A10_01795 [Caldilineaceae bacterium]
MDQIIAQMTEMYGLAAPFDQYIAFWGRSSATWVSLFFQFPTPVNELIATALPGPGIYCC